MLAFWDVLYQQILKAQTWENHVGIWSEPSSRKRFDAFQTHKMGSIKVQTDWGQTKAKETTELNDTKKILVKMSHKELKY